MRVPDRNGEYDGKERYAVACANCGKNTWVAEDELHYCPKCYRMVEKIGGGPYESTR
jgi:hypothetical protein